MILRTFIILIVATCLLLLFSCANQLPLSGGPKDEVPPQIDTSLSIKNYQTSFLKQDIELYFDEYVDLRDANTQILISPPLEYPPLISSRLKKVSVVFNKEEELKENATYVINFGKSIRDFTAGNELLNYSFVFSTGLHIDSLSLSGKVTDAKTGEPRGDALVLLYVDHQDSIVYKERPFYFARTDESGSYRINNLRDDIYKIVALSDDNLSYTYDPETEEIGFIDSLITLRDTLTQIIDLELFREATQPRYKSYDILAQGKAKIEFAGRTDINAITLLDSTGHFISHENGQEFLTLWYQPRHLKSLRYEVFRGTSLDTVQARINTRSIDTLDGPIDIVTMNFETKIGLHPAHPLKIEFDRPLASIDNDLIFMVDTLSRDTLDVKFDSSVFPDLNLVINDQWKEEKELLMTLYPGAITDYYGHSNDTIERYIRIAQEVDFGNIELYPVGFDSLDHVITLLKSDKMVATQIYHPEMEKLVFDHLIPGSYEVQVIVDEVPNGRWDPGNYLEKRPSEKIYKLPLADLRANWIMVEDLNMEELKSQSLQRQNQKKEEKNEATQSGKKSIQPKFK